MSTKQRSECKGGGNGRSRENPPTQRHRPERFPNAGNRDRPGRQSNPARLEQLRGQQWLKFLLLGREGVGGGVVVRLLASQLGRSGSTPSGVAPGPSTTPLVGGCFSGVFRFPRPCVPVMLHIHLASHLIGSQDRDVKSRPNLSSPFSTKCNSVPLNQSKNVNQKVSSHMCVWYFKHYLNYGEFKIVDTAVLKSSELKENVRNMNREYFNVYITSYRNDLIGCSEDKNFMLQQEMLPLKIYSQLTNATFRIIDKTNEHQIEEYEWDIFGKVFLSHIGNSEKSAYPFKQSCLIALVPKASRTPDYLNITLPFANQTWALHFCSMIVLMLLAKMFRSETSFILNALEMWRIALSGATAFRQTRFSLRFFTASCFYLSLLIINSYQSALSSYLTTPHFLPDINTMQELDRSGLFLTADLGDNTEGQELFIESLDFDNPNTFSLLKKFSPVENVCETIDMVAYYRNVSFVTVSHIANYYVKLSKYSENGYPLLHISRECLFVGLLVYEFPRISNHQEYLDTVISRIFEAGIARLVRSSEGEIRTGLWSCTSEDDGAFPRSGGMKPGDERPRARIATEFDLYFTAFGVGSLAFFRGSMNAEAYCNILDTGILPTLWRFLRNGPVDNARCHISRDTMQWYADNNVRRLDQPVQSPDLNPIEHLWDESDRRVRARQARPKSIAQLMEWLQEEWRRIPVDVLQTLVESMPDRVAAVIATRGGPTRF
ncbi:hypothetical protein PR048_029447 [Dryococelus australis]|uniref:Uncharacterized protein n=1 Tax=Dryococelus australis TaxID=614101 RepID=A0ABQ9GDE9_9NEOP|nr:hypothetical protein PR048_029447 [Dryococelus australis]